MHIRGQVVLRKCWAPDPESLRAEEGGRQADGDRDYRGTTRESGTLTADHLGRPGLGPPAPTSPATDDKLQQLRVTFEEISEADLPDPDPSGCN